MTVTTQRYVVRMERHIPLSAIYTRLLFSWHTMDRVDLTFVTVKSVEMMKLHMNLHAMPEHMVSVLTTQESALLKSKPLNQIIINYEILLL